MKTKPILIPIILMASMAFAATSPSATLKVSELKIQVDKVRQTIQEEEKAWAEEQARESEAEKKRKERYEQFTKEKSEANAALVTIESQVQSRMDQIEKLKVRTDNLNGQVLFLRSVILEEVRAYAEMVRNSFPYRQQKRMEMVELLVDDLVKERVSPEEGFNRLWVQYLAEHAAASEAEIYSGQIDVGNGKQTQVKFVRVGKQLLAYTTPTGENMGLLVELEKGKWDFIKEKDMDFDMRSVVRNAIAVAEGKAVPGFVPFPVPMKSFHYQIASENQ